MSSILGIVQQQQQQTRSKKCLGLLWIGQGRFFKSFGSETTPTCPKILFRKLV